jgi:high-affinity nickel-transport protein
VSLLLGLLFGFLQGLRHAFEPDHVVAVSTVIGEQRTMRARVAYAAAWGLGHGAMLVLVGAVLMVLRSELPARLDAVFELGVSLMLIVLGLRAVRHAVAAARVQNRTDDGHGGSAPIASKGESAGVQPARRPIGWRAVGPLAMGMMHGLAGSGGSAPARRSGCPSSRARQGSRSLGCCRRAGECRCCSERPARFR